ncbi:MAG: hypothetical protein INH41_10950 [Myxococcaceae bacterium]|nr:hypothetical protein [Myxococcaceae bacterium]
MGLAARTAHLVEPPAEDSPDFGKHPAAVCTGCPRAQRRPHRRRRARLPPARNLTPHADGRTGWTSEDFVTAMRDGRRKNGEPLRAPMTNLGAAAKRSTEPELRAR